MNTHHTFRAFFSAFACALFIFTLLLPSFAAGADLIFSPPSLTLAAGESAKVTVKVSSPIQSVNGVAGVITIPGFLAASGASKANSILNFWTNEPGIAGNSVSFEGVSLGSGYQGAGGTLMSITVTALRAGSGSLSFSSASVLANDGKGTNVIQTLGMLPVLVSAAAPSPTPASTPAAPLSAASGAPVISSATHPDQKTWYANADPSFSWSAPAGVSAIRILYDESPSSIPTVVYAPPIRSKALSHVADGIHYFHLQFKDKNGWGTPAHFRFNVDTKAPEKFSVIFPHGANGINPQPIVLFNTTDILSGIDHYDVKVGDGGPLTAAASADSNPYALPVQDPGKHVVVVTAYDKAGNSTEGSGNFTIEGIQAPLITSYPAEIPVGDLIRIRGTTYPDATVNVTIRQEQQVVTEESTKSNSLGDFGVVVTKRLGAGAYSFTARVTDIRGARSPETKPLSIAVKSHFFTDAMTFILHYSLLALVTLALLVLIAGVGIWSWFRLAIMARTLHKESAEAETTLHRSFKLLRKDLSDHAAALRKAGAKRKLTAEENDFLEEFKEELIEAERAIEDQLRDIPKR
jgi:hypothetical protein